MAPALQLRPTRSHVLPFLMALFPLLWWVHRGAHTAAVRPSGEALSLTAVATAVAGRVLLSYLCGVAVATLSGVRTTPPSNRYIRAVFFPTDRTLRVLAVLLGAIGVYFVTALLTPIPPMIDDALTPFGVALGWPLFVAVLGLYAVGNAIGTVPLAVQGLVVAGTLSLIAVWVFTLATWLSGVAANRPSP
jgi:hypothetical protein